MTVSRSQRLFQWIGRNELVLFAALLVFAAGVWAFAEIADEVLEAGAHHVDTTIMLAMRTAGDPADPVGPIWFEELARDITALGGTAVLTLLTVGTAGYLLLRREVWTAALVVISVVGALVLSVLLKDVFDRPRPDLVPAHAQVYTASFPSAHAMLSAAVYLTLAAQLARVQDRLVVRGYLLLFALFIVVAVGLSRIYLGVHWPTDVMAGWAAGSAWAALGWGAVYLHDRRQRRIVAAPQPA